MSHPDAGRRVMITELIACMMWQPKSILEAMEATGLSETSTLMWVVEFQRSGLVRVAQRLPRRRGEGQRQYGLRGIKWEWQTKPFALADVPQ